MADRDMSVAASRIYRRMKGGELDHDEGRSLVWVLSQMRSMVEARHLESSRPS